MSETVSTDVDRVLQAVCDSLSQLLSSTPGPLRRITVRAGEVTVDMEWPTAPGVSAPLPAALARPPRSNEAAEICPDAALYYICAPTVGVFYRAPEPGAKPFVSEGDLVEQGQQVAILEAMKLMMSVEADRPGRVAEILVPDATPVEYGQYLIAVAPLDFS